MLIVIAVGGIIFWETIGREVIIYEEVVVAAKDIYQGDIIKKEMLTTKAFQKGNTLKKSIKKESMQNIIGQKSIYNIPENAQITEDFFYCNDFYLKNNESIYVLKPEWIHSMSASIRRGDKVSLFTFDDLEKIGSFRVAFVKDSNDREVKTVESEGDTLLERTDGTAMIQYIEIICNINQYKNILEKIEEKKLLIIPIEGGNTNDKN